MIANPMVSSSPQEGYGRWLMRRLEWDAETVYVQVVEYKEDS